MTYNTSRPSGKRNLKCLFKTAIKACPETNQRPSGIQSRGPYARTNPLRSRTLVTSGVYYTMRHTIQQLITQEHKSSSHTTQAPVEVAIRLLERICQRICSSITFFMCLCDCCVLAFLCFWESINQTRLDLTLMGSYARTGPCFECHLDADFFLGQALITVLNRHYKFLLPEGLEVL